MKIEVIISLTIAIIALVTLIYNVFINRKIQFNQIIASLYKEEKFRTILFNLQDKLKISKENNDFDYFLIIIQELLDISKRKTINCFRRELFILTFHPSFRRYIDNRGDSDVKCMLNGVYSKISKILKKIEKKEMMANYSFGQYSLNDEFDEEKKIECEISDETNFDKAVKGYKDRIS